MSATGPEAKRRPSRGEAAFVLKRSGLVPAAAPLAALTEAGGPPVPLALQWAIAIGAWLASLLVLSVILPILFAGESALLAGIVGTGLCLLSAIVNRLRDHRRPPGAGELFRDHLMLAIGLSGMALLMAALFESMGAERDLPVWLALAAALVLLIANPETLHRFAASVVAVTLAGYLVQSRVAPSALAPVLMAMVLAVWLGQGRWSRLGGNRLLVPFGAAVTVLLLTLIVMATESLHLGIDELVIETSALAASVAAGAAILVGVLGRRGRGDLLAAVSPPLRWPDAPTLVAAVLAATWCLLRAPLLGACLLVWALMQASGHRRLAHLALVAMAVHLALFYYGMETTLASKGLRLLEMATAAALLPLVWMWRARAAGEARSREGPAMKTAASGLARHWPVALTVLGLVVISVSYIRAIAGAERVLADGAVVRLELAPRDPRAFLTGDYMIITLAAANQLGALTAPAGEATAPDDARPRRDGYAIVTLDPRGVAILNRFATRATGLAPGELALVARHRDAGWQIGTDAYYFPEGQGAHYEAARYGEYRLSPQGELLLVRLLDERFRPLPVAEASRGP